MKKEELARQYADKKVEERKEYPLCDMHRRKVLTSFDGYAIEQAYEDGFDKAVEMACKCLEDLNSDHQIISLIDCHDLETDELIRYFKNFIEVEK